jgi:hypothetical protein
MSMVLYFLAESSRAAITWARFSLDRRFIITSAYIIVNILSTDKHWFDDLMSIDVFFS